MFKTNKKIVGKLDLSFDMACEYRKEDKVFDLLMVQLEQKDTKVFEKLGLKIIRVTFEDDYFRILLKRKSNLSGIIIGMLSFQVVLFAIQILWLASKTHLP